MTSFVRPFGPSSAEITTARATRFTSFAGRGTQFTTLCLVDCVLDSVVRADCGVEIVTLLGRCAIPS